jgi:hypothetical protein
VRLLVAAAVVVAASVAAVIALTGRGGHHARATAAERSCPLAIQFGDSDYFGMAVKQTLPLGRRLGRAIVYPCSDGILSPPDPVPPGDGVVVAIAGIRPSVAVGAVGSPHTAYVAYGYFPELPSYPLHEGGIRDRTRGCRVTGRFSLVGRVRGHSSGLLVRADRSSGSLDVRPHVTLVQLLVDGHTRIAGFRRNGLAYVTRNDRIRASGVTCQFPGAGSTAVVARTIAPAT